MLILIKPLMRVCTLVNCKFLILFLVHYFLCYHHFCNALLFIFSSYVLGHEAMKKMSVAHVLVVGLKGLGVEIGKQNSSNNSL